MLFGLNAFTRRLNPNHPYSWFINKLVEESDRIDPPLHKQGEYPVASHFSWH